MERLLGGGDDALVGGRLSGDRGELPRPASQRSGIGPSAEEIEKQQPGDDHADGDNRDDRPLRTLLHRSPPLTIRTAVTRRAAGPRC
jgi:hypothetical protein